MISLLGLNDLGAVPRFLETTIQSGIDVTDLLLVRRESIGDTKAYTTTNSQIFFQVPPGELWYVHSFGARSNAIGAADTFAMGMGYQAIATTFFVPVGEVSRATNPNERCMAVMNSAPFWAGPGAALLVQCTDFNVAAGTLDVIASVTRTVLRV